MAENEPKVVTFEGEIYTRPLGRGISLEGTAPEAYLDDLVETIVPAYHYAKVKITIEATDITHQDIHGD